MTVEIILPKASDTRYFPCLYSCFYISYIIIYVQFNRTVLTMIIMSADMLSDLMRSGPPKDNSLMNIIYTATS